jgi:hypothetical protein
VIEVGATDASLEHANQELTQVMQALTAHPTTAPFISYRLIQRLVTSNPSADYIQRVSQVFGQTGDLNKTIKAILLDPEARNPSVISSTVYGKVKEPLLRFTALMRLLNAHSSIDFGLEGLNYSSKNTFAENATLLRIGELPIGQRNLGSASVFNFFSPDFSPSGALASQSLVAPELQLMTESLMVSTINALGSFIVNGLVRKSSYKLSDYKKQDLEVKLNKQILISIWQQTQGNDETKAKALLDYLDLYLNASQLSMANNTSSYQAIIDAIIATPVLIDKINLVVYAVVNAPVSIIQR